MTGLAAIALVLLDQKPIGLRFHPPVGATYRYSVTTTFENSKNPGKAMVASILTAKILSASGGLTDVQYTSSNVEVKSIGKPTLMSMMAKGSIPGDLIVTTDSLGYVKRRRPLPGKGAMKMMSYSLAGFQLLLYPSHPVRVGETWSISQDRSPQIQRVPVGTTLPQKATLTVHYKLTKADASRATLSIKDSTSGRLIIGSHQALDLSMSSVNSLEYVVELSTGLPLSVARTYSMEDKGNEGTGTTQCTTRMKRI